MRLLVSETDLVGPTETLTGRLSIRITDGVINRLVESLTDKLAHRLIDRYRVLIST